MKRKIDLDYDNPIYVLIGKTEHAAFHVLSDESLPEGFVKVEWSSNGTRDEVPAESIRPMFPRNNGSHHNNTNDDESDEEVRVARPSRQCRDRPLSKPLIKAEAVDDIQTRKPPVKRARTIKDTACKTKPTVKAKRGKAAVNETHKRPELETIATTILPSNALPVSTLLPVDTDGDRSRSNLPLHSSDDDDDDDDNDDRILLPFSNSSAAAAAVAVAVTRIQKTNVMHNNNNKNNNNPPAATTIQPAPSPSPTPPNVGHRPGSPAATMCGMLEVSNDERSASLDTNHDNKDDDDARKPAAKRTWPMPIRPEVVAPAADDFAVVPRPSELYFALPYCPSTKVDRSASPLTTAVAPAGLANAPAGTVGVAVVATAPRVSSPATGTNVAVPLPQTVARQKIKLPRQEQLILQQARRPIRKSGGGGGGRDEVYYYPLPRDGGSLTELVGDDIRAMAHRHSEGSVAQLSSLSSSSPRLKCGGSSSFYAARYQGRYPRLYQFISTDVNGQQFQSFYRREDEVFQLDPEYRPMYHRQIVQNDEQALATSGESAEEQAKADDDDDDDNNNDDDDDDSWGSLSV